MIPWLLAALLGLGYHAGAREVRRFERIAADEILSKLEGDGATVHVQTRLNGIVGGALGDLERVTIRASNFQTPSLPLYTEPERSRSGRVESLELFLDDFVLAGLHVEHLEARIPECRFDYGLARREKTIRLSRSGIGTGLVRVRDKDLEPFILRKFREIKRVTVRIDRDKVFVDGYGEFLVIATSFSVIATLEARDGVRIELANASITLDGRPADPASAKVLLDTLNPVVDLNRDLGLLDAIIVRSIRLRDGFLEASGDAKIPVRVPGRAPSNPGPPNRKEAVRTTLAIPHRAHARYPSADARRRPTRSHRADPCA